MLSSSKSSTCQRQKCRGYREEYLSKQQQRDLSSPPPRSLQRNYRAVPHLANALAGRAASPKKRRQVARPLPDSRPPGAFAWVLRPLCNGRRAMCGAQRLQRSLHSPTRPAVGRATRHLRGSIKTEDDRPFGRGSACHKRPGWREQSGGCKTADVFCLLMLVRAPAERWRPHGQRIAVAWKCGRYAMLGR